MSRATLVFVCVLAALLSPRGVAAQSEQPQFQLGVQFTGAMSSEFDKTDMGLGGRVSWNPVPLFGAEAELNFYPGDFADDPAFSKGRVEGLFGVTVGPQLGRVRPFARFRPGFLTFQEAPAPFACILIFPPPLQCALAGGTTALAVDFGGGVEFFPTDRTFVRIDAGDRAVRYPGPAFDSERNVHDEDFFSHDFRFAIGGGLRF
jgi:hypothetical protein